MRYAISLILLGLLIAGCVQPPQGIGNNTTNGTVTPPANNTTAVPPGYEVADYCQKDSDCVRKNSCCDCGLGEFVNKYNQQPECPPNEPRCACAIRLSHGECNASKCVAVAGVATEPPPQEAGLSFNYSQGECGSEVAPERTDTENGITFIGAVGGGSVCRIAVAELIQADGHYALNISTRAIPGVAACIKCMGAIPFVANISGYNGQVDVYYDGRKVFPTDSSGFCGTSTNGACSQDSDCITGGCSSQVCQAASEPAAITDCMYRECYNAQAYGVSCGCSSGKCRWQ
jgi:eight-cysteine-cluster-containing protein